ncbi:MAG TPA: ABC transporter substrate-binding protein [Rhizomicrobium sp.]|jgi:iron complex transport system substrate-binding protein
MRLKHACHVFALLTILNAASVAADQAPKRIVSGFLCTDEYVFRLVPRERIAALSYLAADTHPVVSTIANKVKGIPLIHASAEEVLRLHPDLFVTYENTGVRMVANIRAAGIPVLQIPWAESLADVRRITRMLGDRLGARQRAAALIAEMDAKLAAARSRAASPDVRTLIYEPNGYLTAGGVSDEILAAAGLRDVAGKMSLTRAGTLPVEAVLSDAPQLLILNDSPEASPARADLVVRHPALAALSGKSLVVRLSLNPLLCAGPWSADIAGKLASLGQQASLLARRRAGP